MSDWGSSADLDFRDRNNVTESNQLDTNADVTTQTHPYLTGAYDERMRIIEYLERYFELTQEPNEDGTITENLEWDSGFQAAIALIKEENK